MKNLNSNSNPSLNSNVKSITIKIVIVLIVIALCIGSYILVSKKVDKKGTQDNVNGVEPKEEITNEALYTQENFPKIDGSTATQPLMKAFMKNFTAKPEETFSNYEFNKTHQAYLNLIEDKVDLIVVTSPSEEELALAKEKNVELEVIPVVKEGFVFYVNSDNKVNNLTVEQVQDIYSGKITNWKDAGGEDNNVLAYQRPTNSGSQTGMLSLVMKEKKLMDAPKENMVQSMAQIINLVSSYNNAKNAIGYSYYYYATTMYESIDPKVANRIKLLQVNGVAPNVQTIKDGSYPFTTSYYIVINKADKEDSSARKLANQMLSTRGQKVALDAGYVPVK